MFSIESEKSLTSSLITHFHVLSNVWSKVLHKNLLLEFYLMILYRLLYLGDHTRESNFYPF